MPRLTLTAKNLSTLHHGAIVVAAASTDDGATLVVGKGFPTALRAQIEGSAATLGITGAADEVRRVPTGGHLAAPVLVVTGLGPKSDGYPAEMLRRAAGAAARELTGSTAAIGMALPSTSTEDDVAIAEGALLGAYTFTRYRDDATAAKARRLEHIELVTPRAHDRALKTGIARAEVLAAAVHATRDLVNTPPLDLFPAAFADLARQAVRGTGVKISVLDEKALAAGGYGGLIGVGQGSSRPPRLVKVTWAPPRSQGKVALVGKGITFDSGGLSIKSAKGMETMKSDMAGAAAVLHTVVAAAVLKLPVQVTGWLCIAENMPSGTAQRPSDVITIRGGKTVEVLNTDAEGRLVLADGLVAALEEDPDVVIDIATLTGAQVVALGARVAAVMGTEAVRGEILDAAGSAGEQFWPMPLPEELRASMNSKVADIANMGERSGGMLVAGLFLREFVGSAPWAHLDIAGPSFNEGPAHGYTPEGGTGVGVRTLLALLEARSR